MYVDARDWSDLSGSSSNSATADLNAAIAEVGKGVLVLPRGEINIDGPIVDHAGVRILGHGRGTRHVSAIQDPGGTTILCDVPGAPVIDFYPTQTSGRRLSGGGVEGVSFINVGAVRPTCAVRARSTVDQRFEIFGQGFSESVAISDVMAPDYWNGVAQADAKGTQRNRWNICGYQVASGDGRVLWMKGNDTNDSSKNIIEYVDGSYCHADFITFGASDNNVAWEVYGTVFGGGPGLPNVCAIRFEGSNGALNGVARSNRIMNATVPTGVGQIRAEGLEKWAYASGAINLSPNMVYADKENGASAPFIGQDAGLIWKPASAYDAPLAKYAIAADTTVTIPVVHKIRGVNFRNNTAQPVTINVGTTQGGAEVFSQVVAGWGNNAVAALAQSWFNVQKTLYISSQNWNGANVDLSFDLVRMWG